jgi:hypothetical protein
MAFDGSKMLLKDEMLMRAEWEPRAQLEGNTSLSDLDFWTVKRAEAFLDASTARGDDILHSHPTALMAEAR